MVEKIVLGGMALTCYFIGGLGGYFFCAIAVMAFLETIPVTTTESSGSKSSSS